MESSDFKFKNKNKMSTAVLLEKVRDLEVPKWNSGTILCYSQ